MFHRIGSRTNNGQRFGGGSLAETSAAAQYNNPGYLRLYVTLLRFRGPITTCNQEELASGPLSYLAQWYATGNLQRPFIAQIYSSIEVFLSWAWGGGVGSSAFD